MQTKPDIQARIPQPFCADTVFASCGGGHDLHDTARAFMTLRFGIEIRFRVCDGQGERYGNPHIDGFARNHLLYSGPVEAMTRRHIGRATGQPKSGRRDNREFEDPNFQDTDHRSTTPR